MFDLTNEQLMKLLHARARRRFTHRYFCFQKNLFCFLFFSKNDFWLIMSITLCFDRWFECVLLICCDFVAIWEWLIDVDLSLVCSGLSRKPMALMKKLRKAKKAAAVDGSKPEVSNHCLCIVFKQQHILFVVCLIVNIVFIWYIFVSIYFFFWIFLNFFWIFLKIVLFCFGKPCVGC